MEVSLEVDGFIISSDFETGNGKNITSVGPNSFRVEAKGDNAGYNWYFALSVTDKGNTPRTVHIEVAADPDYLLSVGCNDFYGNLTTNLWIMKYGDGQYYAFPEFNFNEPGELKVSRQSYRFSFLTVPGSEVRITNCYPLPYSLSLHFANEIVEKHPGIAKLTTIGKSFRGRDINLVEISEGRNNKPNVLVVAGEHPMEFPGQWATWGIIRWLASSIREAIALRQEYRFLIVPTINPDGNVAGNPQKNAQDMDIAHTWPKYDNSILPAAHENNILLDFIKQNVPDIYLGFHGYPGPRAWGDWPHEGCYAVRPEKIIHSKARMCQIVINDYMQWETNGATQHKQILFYADEDSLCEYLAGRFGVPGVVYEPLNQGTWLSMRTGIHVLKTLLKGFESSVQ